MEQINEEIFELTVKKMKEAGAVERHDYQELLEESLEYFRQTGRLVDEDNFKFIMEELLDRWPQAEQKLSE